MFNKSRRVVPQVVPPLSLTLACSDIGPQHSKVLVGTHSPSASPLPQVAVSKTLLDDNIHGPSRILSIRSIFILFAISIVLVTAAVIIPIFVLSEQSIATDLSYKLQTEAFSMLTTEITAELSWVEQTSDSALYYIRGAGYVMPNGTADLLSLWPHTWEHFFSLIQQRPEGSTLVLTSNAEGTSGRVAGLQIYYNEPSYVEIVINDFSNSPDTDGLFRQYNLNVTEQLIGFDQSAHTLLGFPCALVPDPIWNGTTWVDLYLQNSNVDGIVPLLKYMQPLFNPDTGNYTGGLAVSVQFATVREVLASVFGTYKGLALIVDAYEQLVAVSTDADIFSELSDGSYLRRTLDNSEQGWIVQLGDYLRKKDYLVYASTFNTADLDNTITDNNFVLSVGGAKTSYFLTTQAFVHQQLRWQIILLLEQEQFLSLTQSTTHKTIIITVVIVVFVAICSFVVGVVMTRPLFSLSKELQKVSRLELDLCNLNTSRFLEVRMLNHSFRMMHAALSSFKRYVPHGVITNILRTQKEAVVGFENASVTVLFLDIVDFTSLCEDVEPDELAALCGEFIEHMSQIIASYGGTIDKYIGDCIMALFNVPDKIDAHAEKACEAVTACLAALPALNKDWKLRYGRQLFFRAGINTGEMLVGNIGSNARLNFTVIGDNVNIAARLESANKTCGSRILVSESVHKMLTPGKFVTRNLAVVRVSGKNVSTRVFQVYGLAPGKAILSARNIQTYLDVPYAATMAMVPHYEDALSNFEMQRFDQALVSVDVALSMMPQDQASLRLKQRIVEVKALPRVPLDWSHVESLTK